MQTPEPESEGLLPSYIKPLPAHILWEDVEYLTKKGALSIPDSELRDELLKCYIEFASGGLPGVDWHGILAHVEQRSPPGVGLSLLLFQAVMYTGTAYVELKYLKKNGYATRRAARDAFFKKVRVSRTLDGTFPITIAYHNYSFSTTSITKTTRYVSSSHCC